MSILVIFFGLFSVKGKIFILPSTKENMSPLLMAIRLQLEPVVDSLCKRGADENSSDENGNTPLWIALKSRQMDIATTLVCVPYMACDKNVTSRHLETEETRSPCLDIQLFVRNNRKNIVATCSHFLG